MINEFTYNFTQVHEVPYRIKCVRSTVAWGISDGILKEFDVDEPRLCRPFGILVERGKTNFVIRSRELTNEDYTATDLNVAYDQIGLDGQDNTGASLESTAENATLTQDVTSIDVADYVTFSCYLKLISYQTTATVLITANGTDYSQVILNDAGYTRFSVVAPRTGSTMTVGIKIVESGVIIAADCLQLEVGEYATSPIVTISSAGNRSADEVYQDIVTTADTNPLIFTPLWFNKDEGSMSIGYSASNNEHTSVLLNTPEVDGDYLQVAVLKTPTQTKMQAGINQLVDYELGTANESPETQTNQFLAVFNYAQGKQLAALNSFQPISQSTTANQTFDFTDSTRMWLGNNAGSDQIDGYLQTFTYYSKFMQLSENTPGLIITQEFLSAPVLILSDIDTTTFTFTWGAIKNALSYVLQVATDDTFDTIIDEVMVGNVLTATYEDDGYYYRVIAQDGIQQSTPSNTVYFDSAAAQFAIDAMITDTMLIAAANYFLMQLNDTGHRANVPCCYLNIGGTSTTTSFNIMDSSQFTKTYFGGWTFDAAGCEPNGTTGYAKTGFIPSIEQSTNGAGFGINYTESVAASGSGFEGVLTFSPTTAFGFYAFYTGSVVIANINDVTNTTASAPNSVGFRMISRESSTSVHVLVNDTVTDGTMSAIAAPSKEIYLGAYNVNGTPSDYSGIKRNVEIFTQGLTGDDMKTIKTIIDNFNSFVGR